MDLGLRVLGIFLGLSASDCKHGPKLYVGMYVHIYIYIFIYLFIYGWLVVCMYTGTHTQRWAEQHEDRVGRGFVLGWISARKTCQAFLRNLCTTIF